MAHVYVYVHPVTPDVRITLQLRSGKEDDRHPVPR